MKIYFARHGESTHNEAGIIAGNFDADLTEKGLQQAEELTEVIKGVEICTIISSGLQRAYKTAQAVALEKGMEVEVWEDLHEVDYGDCQDKPKPDNYAINLEMTRDGVCDGAETLDDLEVRAQVVIERISQLDCKGDVLIVGHSAFTSIVFALLEGKSGKDFVDHRMGWEFGNAELKVVEKTESDLVIL